VLVDFVVFVVQVVRVVALLAAILVPPVGEFVLAEAVTAVVADVHDGRPADHVVLVHVPVVLHLMWPLA